jgi:hypothetical protein
VPGGKDVDFGRRQELKALARVESSQSGVFESNASVGESRTSGESHLTLSGVRLEWASAQTDGD